MLHFIPQEHWLKLDELLKMPAVEGVMEEVVKKTMMIEEKWLVYLSVGCGGMAKDWVKKKSAWKVEEGMVLFDFINLILGMIKLVSPHTHLI